MHATSEAHTGSDTTVGISGTLVGIGALTFAFFPFALPFAILLAVSAVPLLPLALLALIPLGIAALARRLRPYPRRRRRGDEWRVTQTAETT
jgi:hypothetical protein